MPPETKSDQTVQRGEATPEEVQYGSITGQQSRLSLDAFRSAVTDPSIQLATLDTTIQAKQQLLKQAETDARYWQDQDASFSAKGWDPPAHIRERVIAARQAIIDATRQIQEAQASRPILEQQAAVYDEQRQLNQQVQKRLGDFISGRDIGVSAEERALITQGISGISQDVATTRGLNRSDVPVMQAVAPAVSQALLAQANANRSLFTGINQFQQGLDLSGRQLQAGLAGQNPAANLTGVYSGLRSSNITGSTQQGYGALDYVNAATSGFQAIGQGVAGFKGAPAKPVP